MIGLTNRAGHACDGFVTFNIDGSQSFVVIAKCTYAVEGSDRLQLHNDQVPVVMADQHWGDAADSSVRYEADIAHFKRQVDLVLNASAWAPHGRAVERLEVELATRGWTKSLIVTGNRKWGNGIVGPRSTRPDPFREMPLRYERAFGGVDPRSGTVELRNPIGTGFRTSREDILGTSLPNIERSGSTMAQWNDRPEPVGFASVGRSWAPRRRYGGTYDQRWLDERFPFLPLDFDDRYFLCSPEGQCLAKYVPGEPIALRNMSPEGDLRIELPDFSVGVYVRTDLRRERLTMIPDSVTVEPDAKRVIVTARIRLPIGGKPDCLREVILGSLPSGEERAFLTGKKYFSRRVDEDSGLSVEQDDL